ncbi:hypothetical protein EJ04DRAFT_509123 [Polyplosphaeria fusca]|uniref:Aminoglycoside phosphotransferase domain-containing protein n=1 Tax=Polyplosphaeria fusca TaxID=682080 RepID=A0A9P4R9M9_9PLEO|nr:hypothetical protein EJ04DRAFT_509123 [Polyplosphaeria fusca]
MLQPLTALWKRFLLVLLPLVLTISIFNYFLSSSETMTPPSSPSHVASALLAQQHLSLQSLNEIQRLWAGYGSICNLIAAPNLSPTSSGQTSRSASTANSAISTPQEVQSYILKLITPPHAGREDEGHVRKMLSYQVEQHFYTHLAPALPHSVPVAKAIASINEHHVSGASTTALIMTDLKQTFPVAGEKRAFLDQAQVHAALDWLSSFHGFWWPRAKELDRDTLVRPPRTETRRAVGSVWLNGGYTYLATRRSEYESLAGDDDSEWREPLTGRGEGGSSLAERVAAILASSEDGEGPMDDYMTLIHGDVKSENLFTSVSGDKVAFYDFQYTGLGLGVCDLAKLFTCSVPLGILVENRHVPSKLDMERGERALLERYLANLRNTSGKSYDWDTFVRHWEVALVDWLRFQASWGFWGNTEWLESRVRHILDDRGWRSWMNDTTR